MEFLYIYIFFSYLRKYFAVYRVAYSERHEMPNKRKLIVHVNRIEVMPILFQKNLKFFTWCTYAKQSGGGRFIFKIAEESGKN